MERMVRVHITLLPSDILPFILKSMQINEKGNLKATEHDKYENIEILLAGFD
jgi:hypothetical protein